MKKSCLFLLILSFLTLTSTLYTANVSVFRVNSNRDGYITNSNISFPVQELFAKDFSAVIISSIIISQDKIYFGTRNNKVYCLSSKTGDTIWSYETDSWVDATPAIFENNIYFASRAGTIYSLSKENGSLNWKREIDSQILSSPLVINNLIYIGLGNPANSIVALTLQGNIIYQYNVGQPIFSSPVHYNDNIFIGANDGAVYQFTYSLNLQRKFTTQGGIGSMLYSTPAISDNKLYFAPGGNDKNIYCYNATYGNLLWSRPVSDEIGEIYTSSPAVDLQNVYIVAGNSQKYLSIFNKVTGDKISSIPVSIVSDYLILPSPVVTDDFIVLGNGEGLNIYNKVGEIVYSIASSSILSSPAISYDKLYFADISGNVRSYIVEDKDAPLATISLPKDGDVIFDNATIYGVADDKNFLSYSIFIKEKNAQEWSTITTSKVPAKCELCKLAEISTTRYEDGEYVIMLEVVDAYDNKSQYTVNVIIDNTTPSPEIYQISPAYEAKVNTPQVEIIGKTDGTEVKVNDNLVEVDENKNFKGNVILSNEGRNQIKISSKLNGKIKTLYHILVLDTISPIITITYPETEIYTTVLSQIEISGSINEDDGNVYINDEEVVVESGSFSKIVDLQIGENVIGISAKDSAGNLSTKTIKIIREELFITISSLQDGSITNKRDATLEGTTTAEELFVQGVKIEIEEGGKFERKLDLQEGENEIIIYGKLKNIEKTVKIKVTVDTTPPQLIVTHPPKTTFVTDKNTITIEGKTEKDAKIKIQNENIGINENFEFTKNISLEQEETDIEIIAEDIAGNKKEIYLKIIKIAPQLSLVLYIAHPQNNFLTSQKVIDISGYTNGVEVKIENILVEIKQDGSFTQDIELQKEGENILSIVAKDTTGNAVTKQIKVILDTILPEISELAISDIVVKNNKFYTTKEKINISGKISEEGTVKINDENVIVSEGIFSSEVKLKEGENIIYISAKDIAGNKSEIVKSIFYIKSLHLTLLSPVADTITNKNIIKIEGSTNEIFSLYINNIEKNIQGDAFSIDYQLKEGENDIEVCVKFANMSSCKQIKVILDTIPPQGEFYIEDKLATYVNKTKVNLYITAQDNHSIDKIFVSNFSDFKDALEIRDISIPVLWNLTENDGKKNVHIKIIDIAGNSIILSREIMLDKSHGEGEIVNNIGGEVKTTDGTRVLVPVGSIIIFGNEKLKIVIKKPDDINDYPVSPYENIYSTGIIREIYLSDSSGKKINNQNNNSYKIKGKIAVTLSYAGINLPQDIKESDLRIRYFNEVKKLWETVEGEQIVDTLSKTVTCFTPHLSIFGLFGIKAKPGISIEKLLNYPNPFNPNKEETCFGFDLSDELDGSEVITKVYTPQGTLIWEKITTGIKGYNSFCWNGVDKHGRKLSTGVYFYIVDVKKGSSKVSGKGKILVVK